jgi:hypothetical protein
MDLISKSFIPLSPVHFLRYFFITDSSASNIVVGIERSVTEAVKGFYEIMNLTFRPLSIASSPPRNSASLLAQVIAVDFYDPYSSTDLLITRDSPM